MAPLPPPRKPIFFRLSVVVYSILYSSYLTVLVLFLFQNHGLLSAYAKENDIFGKKDDVKTCNLKKLVRPENQPFLLATY